ARYPARSGSPRGRPARVWPGDAYQPARNDRYRVSRRSDRRRKRQLAHDSRRKVLQDFERSRSRTTECRRRTAGSRQWYEKSRSNARHGKSCDHWRRRDCVLGGLVRTVRKPFAHEVLELDPSTSALIESRRTIVAGGRTSSLFSSHHVGGIPPPGRIREPKQFRSRWGA